MARRTSRRIRYAVVGLGHIAQVAVLPAFAHARRNSELTALISGDRTKLEVLGRRYRVNTRGNYDQFERCLSECDAVYIATPNTEHAEFAIRAAHAGVHVLCEKPLSTTDAECARIIRACREAGVRIMTAYRLHFEPITLEVLRLIRSGRIGEPRVFESTFSMMAKPGNIRTRPETGGGTLYDLGVYCINAARMAFGAEPVAVAAFSVDGARSGFPGVDETSSAVMRFEGDRLATFTASFGAADVSSYRIVGTKGDIHVQPAYDYAEGLAYTLTRNGKAIRKRGRKVDQFAAELLYFSDCILKDREPEPSAEEGAWDLRIIDALLESSRRGELIALRAFGPEPGPRASQATSRPAVRKPRTVKTQTPRE
ncbi:MAG TPA: Gfo/Idh/MocA family oxidoreductase [Vicinamibacterales bacterium]|nr:Gfo/Idh/MocA family oxidoreductase [Vicinamibacterales bacterium]